jgi:hypothetical protein
MPSNPNGPQPFPCGGEGQQPCPPQPAIAYSPDPKATPADRPDELAYSYNEMLAHGQASYEKGLRDGRGK